MTTLKCENDIKPVPCICGGYHTSEEDKLSCAIGKDISSLLIDNPNSTSRRPTILIVTKYCSTSHQPTYFRKKPVVVILPVIKRE